MKLLLTNRDIQILRFLWRWKVSTTAYLHLSFFPKTKAITAYFRLLKLKKAGYLKLYYSEEGNQKLWGLTAKGFAKIKNDFPNLEKQGFRPSSLIHDIKTQVVQLGIFDTVHRKNITCLTEQELHCGPDDLPKFAKDLSHRPDGYWIFNGNKCVALEIELSYKSLTAYYDLAYKYDAVDSINNVLWVVESEGLARRISQQIERFSGGTGHKYSLIYYQDFLNFGTDCKIIAGNFREEKLLFLLEKMGAISLLKKEKTFSTQALAHHNVSCW